MASKARPERLEAVEVPLSGVWVTPMTSGDLHLWITRAAAEKRKAAILAHNLHSMYVWEADLRFRQLYDMADVVLIDGFPVLKLASLFSRRKLTSRYRVGTLDWLPELLRRTPIRRLAVVGGTAAGNDGAVDVLRAVDAGRTVRGWHGEGWTSGRADRIAAELQNFGPDMVIVGLGMPLQENFLLEWWEDLPEALYATVGGAIDQLAGRQKPAPRWLGPLGVEWLFRMLREPRRLSKRYLVEPWMLASLLLRKWVQGRSGPRPGTSQHWPTGRGTRGMSL